MKKLDIKTLKKSAAITCLNNDIAILANFEKMVDGTPTTYLMGGIFVGFVLQGEGSFMVDKHSYTLKKGNIFACYPRNILEKYTFSKDIKAVALFVSEQYAGEFVDKINLDWTIRLMAMAHEVVSMTPAETKRMEVYTSLITERLQCHEGPYKRNSLDSLIMAMIYDLFDIRQHQHHAETLTHRKYSASEKFFLEFIKMLNHAEGHFLNVNGYADQLGITSKYFSNICREITGKTAGAIINEEIIRSAKILLHDKGKSIKQVSDALQFANQSHFASFFHRHTGTTPQRYRKQFV